MRLVLKRIAAYLIDIILVTTVATLISSNSYINMNYKKYNDLYKKYNEENELYTKYYNELQKSYEDKKILEEEYNKLVEIGAYNNDLINYYNDSNIDKEEYKIIIDNLNSNYTNNSINYNYKLLKLSIISNVISIMCILLYFVVIQFYFNGYSLGKYVMNLRIISNNNKKLGILNYFIRTLMVNEVFINVVNIILLVILSKRAYINVNQIIYIVTYILEMIILFMIVFDKNNRGLHDYISNTKVIECKKV